MSRRGKVRELPDSIDVIECANEAEWLEERKNFITASEAAVICGESSFESKFSLYQRKRGLVDDTVMSEDQEEWLYWGHSVEPNIAKRFHEKTGREVKDPGEYTLVVNPEYPWMAATLDRITPKTKPRDGYWIPLELKNRKAWDADDWKDGGIPLSVQIQVQHQMLCCGVDHGAVAALIGGNKFVNRDIVVHPKFRKVLIDGTKDFWDNYIQVGCAPSVDSHPSTKAALHLLHPDDNGETIELDSSFTEVDAELLSVKEDIKFLETMQAELENKVKDALGDNSYGEVDKVPERDKKGKPVLDEDGAPVLCKMRYSWKTQTRKGGAVSATDMTSAEKATLKTWLGDMDIAFKESESTKSRVLRRGKVPKPKKPRKKKA